MPWASTFITYTQCELPIAPPCNNSSSNAEWKTRVHYPLPIHLSKRCCISATATAISHSGASRSQGALHSSSPELDPEQVSAIAASLRNISVLPHVASRNAAPLLDDQLAVMSAASTFQGCWS